jgi:hypothetical protein
MMSRVPDISRLFYRELRGGAPGALLDEGHEAVAVSRLISGSNFVGGAPVEQRVLPPFEHAADRAVYLGNLLKSCRATRMTSSFR